MPGGDGSGPMGVGPMTGRALGACAGGQKISAGRCGRGFGQGRAQGRGQGMGRMNVQNLAPLSQDELSVLKAQEGRLKSGLASVQQKISQMENQDN